MVEKLDTMMAIAAEILGWLIISFILLLVVGTFLAQRHKGSLDDLTADQIKTVVNGGVR